MKTQTDLPPVVRRFIADAGLATQSFGLGRVVGQIYAFLYFSQRPRSLADMQEVLSISKGSASMGVRQLEQWDAVKRVLVRGDRKDYYQANDAFGRILKRVLFDTAAKKMSAYAQLLAEAEAEVEHAKSSDGEGEFIRARIARLRKFHDKVRGAWDNPIVRTLLT